MASSSNDSGHVSGGPFSLPSISSTKEMSIASSPPLDLDPNEFSEESCRDPGDLSSISEFTQVTKKQRKKKKRGGVYPPGSHEAAVRASSQGPEAEQFGGYSFRGYRPMRGSREAVSGTKSTCSGRNSFKGIKATRIFSPQFRLARRVTLTTTTACTACRWGARGPRSRCAWPPSPPATRRTPATPTSPATPRRSRPSSRASSSTPSIGSSSSSGKKESTLQF